jgi:hypothetical protein
MNPSNPALVRVVEARHLGEHRVWLRFDDGLEGEADAGALRGPIFEPLKSAYWPDSRSITWSGRTADPPPSRCTNARDARSTGA